MPTLGFHTLGRPSRATHQLIILVDVGGKAGGQSPILRTMLFVPLATTRAAFIIAKCALE